MKKLLSIFLSIIVATFVLTVHTPDRQSLTDFWGLLPSTASEEQTVNTEIARGVYHEKTGVLDMTKSDSVLALLKKKILKKYPNVVPLLTNMDETWLTRLTISDEGVIVLLERGVYLPKLYGDIRITLSYEELGEAFLEGRQYSHRSNQQMGIRIIDPSRPMVALTFDDGPSVHTDHILDLLETYNGQARTTFFVVGYVTKIRPDTVLRAFNLGCEIAGHSWDHRDQTRVGEQAFRAGLLETNAAIESITGIAPSYYRPPYGALSNSVKKLSGEMGFAIIYWSVDPLDWKNRNADTVYRAIMRDVRDRSIVLCHDLHGTTAAAMDLVIPELIDLGYQLVTVSELFYYSGIIPEAGKVYFHGWQ